MRASVTRRRSSIASVAILVLVTGSPAWGLSPTSSSPRAGAVSVVWENELLSVTAREVSLGAVLAEIARVVGFEVTGAVSGERPVSVEFERLPLDRALRRLLPEQSVMFVYGEGEAGSVRLRQVVLVSSGTPEGPGGTATPRAGTSPDASAASGDPPRPLPAQASLLETLQDHSADVPVEQLLQLTGHRDPAVRAATLQVLARHPGDEQAREVLLSHARDPDPEIRSVTLSLLGDLLSQWPEVEETVMAGLRDPVPATRKTALHAIWDAYSPRAAEALRLALADDDPAIRVTAQELLDIARRSDAGASSGEPDKP
jgi:HEAT repeats